MYTLTINLLFMPSVDPSQTDLQGYNVYSTLNKITQFWLVESSTITDPKLYSVGLPIKFPWKRRNFVECTINKKSHDLLVQFVNNRYSWFWKFSNCTNLSCNFENFPNRSYLLITNCTRGRAISYTNWDCIRLKKKVDSGQGCISKITIT